MLIFNDNAQVAKYITVNLTFVCFKFQAIVFSRVTPTWDEKALLNFLNIKPQLQFTQV